MSQNYLASRSSNLSSFNAIAMNYSTLTVSTLSGVSTLNVSRVITTSTIQVNSSMISLGASTNQVYISSLSYGNFSTSTKWNTSMIDRLSTATIAMSANAQYQMTVSPSQMVTSIMYTSTLGSSWATISAATGLPSATATSYTAGAISGDGRYGLLGTASGVLSTLNSGGGMSAYITNNYGASYTSTLVNPPYVYLPFNNSLTDVYGNSVEDEDDYIYSETQKGLVSLYSAEHVEYDGFDDYIHINYLEDPKNGFVFDDDEQQWYKKEDYEKMKSSK